MSDGSEDQPLTIWAWRLEDRTPWGSTPPNLSIVDSAARYVKIEDLLRKVMELEQHKVLIPCPDNIPGCLVCHWGIGGGPIELALREWIKNNG